MGVPDILPHQNTLLIRASDLKCKEKNIKMLCDGGPLLLFRGPSRDGNNDGVYARESC